MTGLQLASTAYSVSRVLVCVGLLSVFLTALKGYFLIRKLTGKRLSVSQSTLLCEAISSSPAIYTTEYSTKGIASVVLMSVLISLTSFGISVWLLYDRFARQELVKLEDVHVLERFNGQDFSMEVQTQPGNGDWKTFSAHTCDPLDNEVVDGVTMLVFYYVVDSGLDCFDWKAKHAGYTLWRDHANKPIVGSRPPAAHSHSNPTTEAAETRPTTAEGR
jgi:hypothetical protein